MGRKRERRRSDPAQPPKMGQGTNNQCQSQHWRPRGKKNRGHEATAHANTARRLRGTHKPAQKPVWHWLSPALL